MVKSFDETLNAAERAVATVKAWTASERKQFELGRLAGILEGRVNGRNDREDDVTAAFARGRVAGIRDAMAALESEYAHSKWPGGNFLDAIDTLKALLPPTSGGEKACFACAVSDTCPVHAPKPAAEKP